MESLTPLNREGGARCLVLGGSGSLGREVCGRLHGEGARVMFTYFKGEVVARGLEEKYPGMRGIELDLSASEGIGETVLEVGRELGGLDGIIHTAAVGVKTDKGVPLEEFPTAKEISVSDWDYLMAVNLRSVFLVSSALPEAMHTDGGNVVFLGSIDGTKPVPAPLHYAASKGAMEAMTRTLAKELQGTKIKVNAVVPGVMETGLSRTLPTSHRDEYLKHTSAKRFGTIEEVAALVTWLTLENTYINGQALIVDGGL